MTNQTQAIPAPAPPATRAWSNRILIAALAGILFLTLYPFEFSLHTKLAPGASPFFLGKENKGGGVLDVVLNIFLFMPFGFALTAKLRGKGKSWPAAFFYTWIAGAFLSYCIEFLQIYIPARDSGWEDVFTNSTGAAIGFLSFEFCGNAASKLLSAWEQRAESWLTLPRAAVILCAYFAACTLYSITLQNQTHLGNWSPDCFLVFGNDATGRHAWRGKLTRAEIWDRDVGKGLAEQLTRGKESGPDADGALAKFDFSSVPPNQDSARLFVPLLLETTSAQQSNGSEVPWETFASIASAQPVANLIGELQRTNQFSIRVVFQPTDIANSDGRIVSISEPSGLSDLYLRQEYASLVFWFRNRVSVERPTLAWTISNLLAPNQTRDVLFSYDGSDLHLYVDGRNLEDRYLGPGAAFAEKFRRVKQGELNGYKDIFYAVVFLPIGWLVGMAAGKVPWGRLLIPFGLSLLLGPLILECVLSRISGRSFSVANFTLSAGMVLAGILWINSDGLPARREDPGHYLWP
ncbi:MAG TPA: VanZ family protein [Candidatus Acidoferrales bacterium]|nr:VanZ family protein [Candidatus Acidoferrales bacterium]